MRRVDDLIQCWGSNPGCWALSSARSAKALSADGGVSGTLTGVARELILTGLAGGDNKALAERLMQIERRLAVLDGLAREMCDKSERIEAIARDLRAKFDALLSALSSSEGAV